MSEFDAWKEVANLQAEITRLKDANNELVEALEQIFNVPVKQNDNLNAVREMVLIANKALAKAKGIE